MNESSAKVLRNGVLRWIGVAAAFALLLLAPTTGSAQEACIKQVSGAPTIDGVVAPGLLSAGCTPDPVWATVSPGEFQPGSSLPRAHLYLAYHPGSSTLSVGVTVSGDGDLSNQDYVSLFFDADNNNAYNDGDFALRFQGTSEVQIETGVECDQATGNILYYRFVGEGEGGGWDPPTLNPAGVDAKVAYDFDSSTDRLP